MPALLRMLLLVVGLGILPLQAQLVPVQANLDAQAQRRLQTDAQESNRRRRIEDNTLRLVPALDPSSFTRENGPAQTLQAMAALADLLSDNITPRDALQQASKKSPVDHTVTQLTSAYLLRCWSAISHQLTAADLTRMRKGEEPETPLKLPPFQP